MLANVCGYSGSDLADDGGFGLADCGLHLCGCNWQIHTRVCVRGIKSDLQMQSEEERE